MDYLDKWFADIDRKALEDMGLYEQFKEVARPFAVKWMADRRADHHALYAEMTTAIVAFLKKHNPESADQLDRL